MRALATGEVEAGTVTTVNSAGFVSPPPHRHGRGSARKALVLGHPRTDLHRWPDGSLRYQPFRNRKGHRDINAERAERRRMRLARR